MAHNDGGVSANQVTVPDMCIFCFDVLYAELFNLEPPRDPKFTNEALWVLLRDRLQSSYYCITSFFVSLVRCS